MERNKKGRKKIITEIYMSVGEVFVPVVAFVKYPLRRIGFPSSSSSDCIYSFLNAPLLP